MSRQRCAVIDIPGLVARYVDHRMPALSKFAAAGKLVPLTSAAPQLNCISQATFLTGVSPAQHGVIGDGWFHREIGEVRFWPQHAAAVQTPAIWDTARQRDPSFKTACVCWFMAMYGGADWAVTPHPHHAADGRVVPNLCTRPASLARSLHEELGPFPIYDFWGPRSSIRSTEWIADAALWLEDQYRPDLSLIFLPHLDYAPHCHGPDSKRVDEALRELDAVLRRVLHHYAQRDVSVVILSEFGVTPVSRAVHLNRRLREHGWLDVRYVEGREVLHPGGCKALAVADMQIAHVYVSDPKLLDDVKAVLAAEPGVEEVIDGEGKHTRGMDHPRSGELIALAEPDAWFTYYFWNDDRVAPDYARSVDIFRKPGYDPLELFIDPKKRHGLPAFELAMAVAQDKLGVRRTVDLVPLDAGMLRGAHGLSTAPPDAPILITQRPQWVPEPSLPMLQVRDRLLAHAGLADG